MDKQIWALVQTLITAPDPEEQSDQVLQYLLFHLHLLEALLHGSVILIFHDVNYPISLQTLTLDGVTSFILLKTLNTHVKA